MLYNTSRDAKEGTLKTYLSVRYLHISIQVMRPNELESPLQWPSHVSWRWLRSEAANHTNKVLWHHRELGMIVVVLITHGWHLAAFLAWRMGQPKWNKEGNCCLFLWVFTAHWLSSFTHTWRKGCVCLWWTLPFFLLPCTTSSGSSFVCTNHKKQGLPKFQHRLLEV